MRIIGMMLSKNLSASWVHKSTTPKTIGFKIGSAEGRKVYAKLVERKLNMMVRPFSVVRL